LEPDESAGCAILGVQVRDCGRAEALALLHQAIAANRHLKVAFCNAHAANTAWADADFRSALSRFTVFPDGFGVDLASRWLRGRPFAANLNGTDFMPELIRSSPRPLRIALIGGRPGVAKRAAAALAEMDRRHAFAPILHGFAPAEDILAWLDAMRETPADIILVAMGNPKQELWIDAHLTADHGRLAVGVGALFDFLAGEVSRAPEWVRAARLEWMWRLMLEPKRLFRRYVLGNPLFLLRVLLTKAGMARR
jgi:exopolysaccharide biosynthesis WecB/TagA/CpsF family protein